MDHITRGVPRKKAQRVKLMKWSEKPFVEAESVQVMVREGRGSEAVQLQEFLWRSRMLIRACGSFAGLDDRYFRGAVRRRRDNSKLVHAIAAWASLLAR